MERGNEEKEGKVERAGEIVKNNKLKHNLLYGCEGRKWLVFVLVLHVGVSFCLDVYQIFLETFELTFRLCEGGLRTWLFHLSLEVSGPISVFSSFPQEAPAGKFSRLKLTPRLHGSLSDFRERKSPWKETRVGRLLRQIETNNEHGEHPLLELLVSI